MVRQPSCSNCEPPRASPDDDLWSRISRSRGAFQRTGVAGLKAVIACAIDDPQTGFHPVGGECLWAVLSDGPQSVVATTDGYEGPDELTKDMIR